MGHDKRLVVSGLGLAALLAIGLIAARESGAHVRLFNPSGGQKLFWKNPTSIPITIDPAGSDDIADDSERSAIRLAMRAWNEDPGSKAQLVEGASRSRTRARTGPTRPRRSSSSTRPTARASSPA